MKNLKCAGKLLTIPVAVDDRRAANGCVAADDCAVAEDFLAGTDCGVAAAACGLTSAFWLTIRIAAGLFYRRYWLSTQLAGELPRAS